MRVERLEVGLGLTRRPVDLRQPLDSVTVAGTDRERILERARRLLRTSEMLAEHRAELEVRGDLLLGRRVALEQAHENVRELRPRLALLVDSSQSGERGHAVRIGVESILVGTDRLDWLRQRLVDLGDLHEQLGPL